MIRSCLILVLIFSCELYSQLIQPEDLIYQGAFNLPQGSGGSTWEYSGYGATFFPDGDPDGEADDYPGSIFAIGHDHQQMVSEISIPVPIISETKNYFELNTASTLQPFTDITQNMFGELEIPRADLAYCQIDGQDKLFFCWGQHYQFERVPSHGCCNVDFEQLDIQGPWFLGSHTNYILNDYLFFIPQYWADQYFDGYRFGSGRFRDGGWGGQGPALLTFYPKNNDGEYPQNNGILDQVDLLLLYGEEIANTPEIQNSDDKKLNIYGEADEWSGAEFVTSGNDAAVVFVGTKGLGNHWYGFGDGTVWPHEGPYPDVTEWPHDERGWWSDSIHAYILFYSPFDLAKVKTGELLPYEVQPYATLDINDFMFDPGFDFYRYKRYTTGAVCYDHDQHTLYLFERMAGENEKSIVHVWKVQSQTSIKEHNSNRNDFNCEVFPNPFHHNLKILFRSAETNPLSIKIFNVNGQKVFEKNSIFVTQGLKQIVWNGKDQHKRNLASGIYLISIESKKQRIVKKVIKINKLY